MTETFCDRCHTPIRGGADDLRYTSDYDQIMLYLGAMVKKTTEKDRGNFDLCGTCMVAMMDLIRNFILNGRSKW